MAPAKAPEPDASASPTSEPKPADKAEPKAEDGKAKAAPKPPAKPQLDPKFKMRRLVGSGAALGVLGFLVLASLSTGDAATSEQDKLETISRAANVASTTDLDDPAAAAEPDSAQAALTVEIGRAQTFYAQNRSYIGFEPVTKHVGALTIGSDKVALAFQDPDSCWIGGAIAGRDLVPPTVSNPTDCLQVLGYN